MPCLTLPAGTGPDGLPVGIMTRSVGDIALFRAAMTAIAYTPPTVLETAAQGEPTRSLAKSYGVSISTISRLAV